MRSCTASLYTSCHRHRAAGSTELPWREHKGDGFDMALLRRRDAHPAFLGFQLYEDDLGDNGDSMVRLRLRVMPTCFLVLPALRVDGVLIRHHDTRLFHKFGASCPA